MRLCECQCLDVKVKVLQFIVDGLSLHVVHSAHEQQGSGGVVPHQEDKRVIGVKQLGLFNLFLLQLFLSGSGLGSQLQGRPLEDGAEVEVALTLPGKPREVCHLLVPGVCQAQSRQGLLQPTKKARGLKVSKLELQQSIFSLIDYSIN